MSLFRYSNSNLKPFEQSHLNMAKCEYIQDKIIKHSADEKANTSYHHFKMRMEYFSKIIP